MNPDKTYLFSQDETDKLEEATKAHEEAQQLFQKMCALSEYAVGQHWGPKYFMRVMKAIGPLFTEIEMNVLETSENLNRIKKDLAEKGCVERGPVGVYIPLSKD